MGDDPSAEVLPELRAVEETIGESIRSEEPLLTEISRYVIDAGGKRIRPTVILLAFRAVGGRDAKPAVRIAAAIEMIHSATLLHDDINDGGVNRRGREAAYLKYGVQNTLVTGDFLYVKAFAIAGQFPADMIELTAKVCAGLAEGEIRQRRLSGDLRATREQYLDVVRKKTAFPISGGARVGATLGGGQPEVVEALAQYGLNLGIAFQIVDDILDVVGDERTLGKRVGSDVREGNMTLLPIHALNDGASIDVRLLARLLQKREKTEAETAQVLGMLRDSGAVEKARVDARHFTANAKESLADLQDSPFKDALLRLADFVIARQA